MGAAANGSGTAWIQRVGGGGNSRVPYTPALFSVPANIKIFLPISLQFWTFRHQAMVHGGAESREVAFDVRIESDAIDTCNAHLRSSSRYPDNGPVKRHGPRPIPILYIERTDVGRERSVTYGSIVAVRELGSGCLSISFDPTNDPM